MKRGVRKSHGLDIRRRRQTGYLRSEFAESVTLYKKTFVR